METGKIHADEMFLDQVRVGAAKSEGEAPEKHTQKTWI